MNWTSNGCLVQGWPSSRCRMKEETDRSRESEEPGASGPERRRARLLPGPRALSVAHLLWCLSMFSLAKCLLKLSLLYLSSFYGFVCLFVSWNKELWNKIDIKFMSHVTCSEVYFRREKWSYNTSSHDRVHIFSHFSEKWWYSNKKENVMNEGSKNHGMWEWGFGNT